MPIKLTISQEPNGVLFSGSGTLNTSSFPQNLPSGNSNFGGGQFFQGPTKLIGAAVGQTHVRIGLLPNLAPINTVTTINYYGINNIINLTPGQTGNFFSVGSPWTYTPWLNSLSYSQNYISNQPFNFSYLIPNETYLSLGMIIQNNTYTWSNQYNGLSDSLQVEVLTPQNANVIITIQQVLGTVNVSVVGTIDPNGLVSAGVFSYNPGGYLQAIK